MWYANYLNLLWYVSYIAGIFCVVVYKRLSCWWLLYNGGVVVCLFFLNGIYGTNKKCGSFLFLYLRLYFPILQLQEWMWTFIIWLVGLCVLYFYSIDSVFPSNHSFVFHFSTFVFLSFCQSFCNLWSQ